MQDTRFCLTKYICTKDNDLSSIKVCGTMITCFVETGGYSYQIPIFCQYIDFRWDMVIETTRSMRATWTSGTAQYSCRGARSAIRTRTFSCFWLPFLICVSTPRQLSSYHEIRTVGVSLPTPMMVPHYRLARHSRGATVQASQRVPGTSSTNATKVLADSDHATERGVC